MSLLGITERVVSTDAQRPNRFLTGSFRLTLNDPRISKLTTDKVAFCGTT